MRLMSILLLPFLASLCAAFMPSNARNREAWFCGAVSLSCFGILVSFYPQIAAGEVIRFSLTWLPQYGLTFGLRLDGMAWMFASLVTFIGTLVVMYARYYMSPADPVPRFFAFLMSFMGSMLGMVLSGNLIQLVLFWELTSLSSFMLIAYWYHLADARRGARMASMVTAAGGLCLFAGVILLGQVVGSYDLDQVMASSRQIHASSWYPAIVILIGLGALTKSAQFPFHFWLPHAMFAPTPVSAYLHSATMVKAGVFLLARLWPVLSGTDLWFAIFGIAGLCSLLLGGLAAIFQRDIKGVLAYSTISHLGLITLLLSMNSPLALVAAVFHMINHATFKASLFMAAGIVDHETGTRDLRRLSGLATAMPITATLAVVAAASMAGVPLLNGFISKEMFFAETIFAGHSPLIRIGLPAFATLAGMFSVGYSLRFIHQVFFGPPATDLPRKPHDPTHWMLAPSGLLVLACLLVGVLPGLTVGPVLYVSARSILGDATPQFSLAVWHGLTWPLVMSMLALIGGIVLYLLLNRRTAGAHGRAPIISHLNGKRIFDVAIVSLIRAADRLTRVVYSRRLQSQLVTIVCVAIGAAWLGIAHTETFWGEEPLTPVDPVFAIMWFVGAVCALGAALQAKYHRLAALIMVGGTGLITSLTFAWFSAPDLALTQIAVEVVTLVLMLLGLRWLPRRIEIDDARRRTWRARARRGRDLLVAIAAGGGMAALVYAVLTRPRVFGLAEFFVDRSLPQGGGHNVVNVILVDFRGFDTFGEITVVGIVALTVYALLRRFRPAPESINVPRAQREDGERPQALPDPHEPLPTGYMRIPAVLVRMLMPMAVLVSLFFLLRGHNAPGGGFVGGLVMATAVIAQYMIAGTMWVESRTRIRPQYWIAGGLLAATGAGMSSWLASRTFLTAISGDIHLPVIGDVHLSTALLFDLGVYMLVIGATVLILVAIAHQSLRSHRRPAALAAATEVQVETAVTATNPADR